MEKEEKIILMLMIGGVMLQLIIWSQQKIGYLSFPYFGFGGIVLVIVYLLLLKKLTLCPNCGSKEVLAKHGLIQGKERDYFWCEECHCKWSIENSR